MPCRSDGYEQYNYELATKVACELAEHIERNSKVPLLNIMSISTETRAWVQAHREVDRQRILEEGRAAQVEKLKKQAIAKLTKQEQEALGI